MIDKAALAVLVSETYPLDIRVYLLEKLLSHLAVDLQVNRYSDLIILIILYNQIMNLLIYTTTVPLTCNRLLEFFKNPGCSH